MNTLNNIFERIKNESLLLPDFQRDYKWNTNKQRSLLSSVILNFPVGSSLILKGMSTDFALRKIGEKEQYELSNEFECEYLLDGQQRTTTLFNAFNNTFNPEQFESESALISFMRKKSNPLKVRWFLRFPNNQESNDNITDIFNAKKLIFNKDNLDLYEPGDISDMFLAETFHEKNSKGTTKWYSPFYALAEKQQLKEDAKIRTTFINKCSENGVLPLFLLGDKAGQSIIKRILKKIASNNSDYLIDSLRNDFDEIKRKYDSDDLLVDYTSIEELESGGDDYDNILSQIFSTHQTEWVNDVFNYLKIDIYESYELMSIVTNDIRRAIPIFCHLNEGGMPLDDFDLIAAKAAKKLVGDTESYSLSKVVRGVFAKPLLLSEPLKISTFSNTGLLQLDNFDNLDDGLPTGYIKSTILSVCTMLATTEACRESNSELKISKSDTSSKTLMSLEARDIRKHIEVATTSVLRAFAFLVINCGVTNAKKLHYKLMIQPIAFALTNDEYWTDSTCLKRIEHWYWTSVFSGKYLYDQSAVVIEDTNLLYNWMSGKKPDEIKVRDTKIFSMKEYSSKELLTQQLPEAPKEGIKTCLLQYVLSTRPFDLLANDTMQTSAYVQDESGSVSLHKPGALHDHHIIPVDICKSLGEKSEEVRKNPNHILNSPLNRVLISSKANLAISSLAPIKYFSGIGQGCYTSEVLSTQFINQDFADIHSGDSDNSKIQAVLEKRFDDIVSKVKQELLTTR